MRIWTYRKSGWHILVFITFIWANKWTMNGRMTYSVIFIKILILIINKYLSLQKFSFMWLFFSIVKGISMSMTLTWLERQMQTSQNVAQKYRSHIWLIIYIWHQETMTSRSAVSDEILWKNSNLIHNILWTCQEIKILMKHIYSKFDLITAFEYIIGKPTKYYWSN